MDTVAGQRDGGFVVSLRVPDYRLLWISILLSASGQWTLLLGRGWLVHDLTHSSSWVGIVTFAGMVPYLLATPIGGVFADRVDRRYVGIAMQGLSCLASIVLAALVFAGAAQAWEVVALALLAGIGRAAETPATISLIPNVVPERYLLNAISLNSVATFGSRLLGPAVGALLLQFTGVGAVFAMTAGLYVFAMLCLWRVRRPETHPVSAENIWRQNVETWRYVFIAPMMAMTFLVVGLHCALTMSFDAVLPQFADRTLHGSSGTYGLLVMAFGAGTIAGTFSLGGLRTDTAKGPLLFATGILSGVTTAALALAHAPLAAFIVMAGMGASQGIFMALANTLVQEAVPDALRGRVSAAFLMGTGGVMSIANLVVGEMADRAGIGAVLLVPALLFITALLALSGVVPGLRRLYGTGSLPTMPIAARAEGA